MHTLNFSIFKNIFKYFYVTILIFTFLACSQSQSSDNNSISQAASLSAQKEEIKNPSDIRTEMIDPLVTTRGNTAWIVYYWSDHGLTNGIPFASKGKSTRIFVRENGIWLCIHGHYTLL